MNSRVSRSISRFWNSILTSSLASSSLHLHFHLKQETSIGQVVGLVVFLACRFVVGFVSELVKSASLDRLYGLFLIAGIRSSLLVWLSCILVFILLVFLFLIFVYLFGRIWSILWTRDRGTLGFESFLDGWELFQEGGELLDVERDSLQLVLAFATPVAIVIQSKGPTFFPGSISSSFS